MKKTMSKMVLGLLLACMVLAPLGCRAVMIGSSAVWQAGTAVIDPFDQDGFWDSWGDYLDSSSQSMRNKMESLHRSFDRHFMLHDWDDPTN